MTADIVASFESGFEALSESQGLTPELIWESGCDSIRIWTRSAGTRSAGTRSVKSAFAPRIFLSAGIHGDEPCGPDALLRFLEIHKLAPDCDWVIAPVLNPSGLRCGTRENAKGIDLNRDFYRKESGEVQALSRWWETQGRSCDIHLSLHEDWETDGLYLYEINTSRMDPIAGKVLDTLRDVVPLQLIGPVDGHELSAPGLILHDPEPDEEFGWPEAIWLARNFPVLSITLEGPGKRPCGLRTADLTTALVAVVVEAESMAADSFPRPSACGTS